MIQVSDYITNAFSDADAKVITPLIESELEKTGTVTLDFSGIRFFTTLFFNNSVCKYVLRYGPEGFLRRFKLQGLSEIGLDTFQHSFDNACNLAALSPEKQNAFTDAIENDLRNMIEGL